MPNATHATTGTHAQGKLWGGRFAGASATALEDLSRSPASYFRMVRFDAIGSRAHAHELERAGLLDAGEAAQICSALDRIVADHDAGVIAPTPDDEDVHGYLERILTERLGALGGKLRAGRSRNDQAANELRLYLRDSATSLSQQLARLIDVLIGRAEEHAATVAPGFTHLQPAQPIVFGHQLLAHGFALGRDLRRLRAAWESSELSPLGAAALAGSTLSGDTLAAAREQGLAGVAPNSIDGVGSRDHVADFLYATAMLATDLSRLAEEITLWSSVQFGWVTLADAYSTGSSIMPQKKNPDIAELTRGKAPRLVANLTGMLGVLKGLPFAYNRDLGEDKGFAFDSADTLHTVLPAMSGLLATMRVHPERMRQQAGLGFTLATELADWLAEQGIPFSEAHDIAGAVVRLCEDQNLQLDELRLEQARSVDPRITADALSRLTLESALERRRFPGGTSPDNIAVQTGHLSQAVADTLQDMGVRPVTEGEL